jgi:hypothetical protein
VQYGIPTYSSSLSSLWLQTRITVAGVRECNVNSNLVESDTVYKSGGPIKQNEAAKALLRDGV